jgi:hypothetical protein
MLMKSLKLQVLKELTNQMKMKNLEVRIDRPASTTYNLHLFYEGIKK